MNEYTERQVKRKSKVEVYCMNESTVKSTDLLRLYADAAEIPWLFQVEGGGAAQHINC